MKLSTKNSPFLLALLLPSVAASLAPHTIETTPDDGVSIAAAVAAGPERPSSSPIPPIPRRGVPTKDAPVDGKDGKPHLGPFVETDATHANAESDSKDLPQLKGRPDDPTVVDGKKIPETNDGVMFDKNRVHAQEGTTGTEGGVSEKDKARKAQEGRTGEKVVTQPEAPKEQPPLPHSEEEKLRGKSKDKLKTTEKDDDADFTGLEVCVLYSADCILISCARAH